MLNQNEQNGEKFSLEKFLDARNKCISAVNKTISEVKVGMNEKEIKEILHQNMFSIGVAKFWHPTKIRIGSDTTKTFRLENDPNLKCENHDLCFIDVGPIINEHEADYGRTFSFAPSPHQHLIEACHEVYSQTSHAWKTKKLNGVELFQFAEQLSKELGYELNPLMSGHRLGDFPHQLFSKDSLFKYNLKPTENFWVLEIHLVDHKNNRGAFFEDLLM